ncbi:hypothetical protein WJX84_008952 [Apatococcus fuscideae]|uniref:S-adenosyl-L-methionine-dependent methyltransferase n=1 Tax=Apatococcus fuscideae TaxID=2026836 RepID=A0AAW1T382_9CHLO
MSHPWWSTPPVHAPPTHLIADAEHFRQNTGSFWNRFYQDNQRSFYKDRHYLGNEFPELLHGSCNLLEVGCGPGNTAFPLLESNAGMHVWACDSSKEAVRLFRAHPSDARARTQAWVADIVHDDLTAHAPPASMDFCTMVFVLSAIPQTSQLKALQQVVGMLKPGHGRLLLRDYAAGDYAQQRFRASARRQQLDDCSFVRGDGTLACYFSEDDLRKLLEAAGLKVHQLEVHTRTITNHLEGKEGMGLGDLFGQPVLEAEEETLDVGMGLHVGCRCVSREHRHLLRHTGLMRWESSLALARFLIACPYVVAGRRVVERATAPGDTKPLPLYGCSSRMGPCTQFRGPDCLCTQVIVERAGTTLPALGADGAAGGTACHRAVLVDMERGGYKRRPQSLDGLPTAAGLTEIV